MMTIGTSSCGSFEEAQLARFASRSAHGSSSPTRRATALRALPCRPNRRPDRPQAHRRLGSCCRSTAERSLQAPRARPGASENLVGGTANLGTRSEELYARQARAPEGREVGLRRENPVPAACKRTSGAQRPWRRGRKARLRPRIAIRRVQARCCAKNSCSEGPERDFPAKTPVRTGRIRCWGQELGPRGRGPTPLPVRLRIPRNGAGPQGAMAGG
jgi:hypothetical protein